MSAASELRILENGRTLFNEEARYVIPLYQRAYAWGEKEITQLIDDINDVESDTAQYCLGSLIVSQKEDNLFEVVDGQQRLTTLFLLLSYLHSVKQFNDFLCSLSFECRKRSNFTLENISNLIEIINEKKSCSLTDEEQIEQNIQCGLKIIAEKMTELRTENENFYEEFSKKLEKVIIYRIEVPKHTDLNHYFEIMNVRGEQLEQHDVLKARLMKYLPENEQAMFALIWEACSDMTGYVQMNRFTKELRERVFGNEWNRLPTANLDLTMFDSNKKTEPSLIQDIIQPAFGVQDNYEDDNKIERIRFESIIDFPYFLLHALKVFTKLYCEQNDDLTPRLLDDKRLADAFENVIEKGELCGIGEIKENRMIFSRKFIITLLRCRFLFDKYIIKREFANEYKIGAWSLKELKVSGENKRKKKAYYYVNTVFWKADECEQKRKSNELIRHKENLMLQSCLRVSYTSPKIMHWITELLIWLMRNNCENLNHLDLYGIETESFVSKAVKSSYLCLSDIEREKLGVATPHIVFNYLDYLLWHENTKKFDDFVFEFRNSVEHWYPRNPSEGTFDRWEENENDPEDNVNNFGNLCIVSRRVNSRFSNMPPEAKKVTFDKMIGSGSLKLRIMSELTERDGDINASTVWKKRLYRDHGIAMLNKLKEACDKSY